MLEIYKQSIISWYNNDPFTRGAAIAYYTIFSFPALLIILMGIANSLIDEKIIESSIVSYLKTIIGKDAAIETFQTVDRVNLAEGETLIFVFGGAVLVYTALKLFVQLQNGLNDIWQIKTEKFKLKRFFRRRLYSFGLMISLGFILLVSLVLTSSLTVLSDWISKNIGTEFQVIFHALNLSLSLTIISFMFGLILKILPDKHIASKAAMHGAIVAAILFMIGQYALGIYFDIAEPQSAYGVSGSVILLMLWVSYSTVILLFGAEVSKTYSDMRSKNLKNG